MRKLIISFITILFSVACSENKVEQKKDTIQVKEEVKEKSFQLKLNNLTLNDSVLLDAFCGPVLRDTNRKERPYYAARRVGQETYFSDETYSLIAELKADTVTAVIMNKSFYGKDSSYCAVAIASSIEHYDCRFCSGMLGVFVLQKNKSGKWDCINFDHDLMLDGMHGAISTIPSLYQVGNECWALDVSQIYYSHGTVMQTDYSFIVLDSVFTHIDIDEVPGEQYFYYDTYGSCDEENSITCERYETKLQFSRPSGAGLYDDLTMITEGSIEDKPKTTKQYHRKRVYRWKDSAYVKISDSNPKGK